MVGTTTAMPDDYKPGPIFVSWNTTVEPKPVPEPRIGPGLILERGRERFIVSYIYTPTKPGDEPYFHVYSQTRSRWSGWSTPARADTIRPAPWFRALLLSGFRIIRPADEEKNNAQ